MSGRFSRAQLAAALILSFTLVGGRLGAQSPNTAGLVVLVVDSSVVLQAASDSRPAAARATRLVRITFIRASLSWVAGTPASRSVHPER